MADPRLTVSVCIPRCTDTHATLVSAEGEEILTVPWKHLNFLLDVLEAAAARQGTSDNDQQTER